jgi:hypothetical protein
LPTSGRPPQSSGLIPIVRAGVRQAVFRLFCLTAARKRYLHIQSKSRKTKPVKA